MTARCPRHSMYSGHFCLRRPDFGNGVCYNQCWRGEALSSQRQLGFTELSEGSIRKDEHPFGLLGASQPPTSPSTAVRGV